MGYIYKITNTRNGKAYIGQTINKLENRINGHFSRSSSPALHNAIQKYGRDAFTFEILHETLDIFLDDLEVAEIKRYNTLAPRGYNLTGGGNTNKVVSDKTRQKMSDAAKGRRHTLKARKKMSESHKGKPLSSEHRKKLKGKPRTPETCRKISTSLRGLKRKPQSPEHRMKIGEANAHPERPKAFEILNSLPESTPLAERRKILREKFPERNRYCIHRLQTAPT